MITILRSLIKRLKWPNYYSYNLNIPLDYYYYVKEYLKSQTTYLTTDVIFNNNSLNFFMCCIKLKRVSQLK